MRQLRDIVPIEEGLQAYRDLVFQEDIDGFQDVPIRPLPACVVIRRFLIAENRQLCRFQAERGEPLDIGLIPDKPPDADQLKMLGVFVGQPAAQLPNLSGTLFSLVYSGF